MDAPEKRRTKTNTQKVKMKTIGMLGGMSWESTVSYYRAINEGVKDALGGFHSAKICMVSVDFEPIEQLQRQGDWAAMATMLSSAAQSVEAGGAEVLLICTNTMHKVAAEVEKSVSIPLLHIADATGQSLVNANVKKVGLLGTRFTMEQEFYKARLTEKYNVDVLIPKDDDRQMIHQVIFSELCLGQVKQASKKAYLEVIDGLQSQGAEAVILGCTEIALLVEQQDTDVPLFDTTQIHAQRAVEFALSDDDN